jgi:transitional endoplasmic reticulum ATPase
MLAKAVATESGANFIAVRGPEILSKWVGESEKAIREIFRKARQYAPAVIFFDEIDAITPMRGAGYDSGVTERVVNQLLAEMDGIEEMQHVAVIAATNRPDIVDPALLRPGRFEKMILVPPPDRNARVDILKVHTSKVPLAPDVDLNDLGAKTEGYTGADIAALVREAGLVALREGLRKGMRAEELKVNWAHFMEAMRKVKPSVTQEMTQFYASWFDRARQQLPKQVVKPSTFA